MKYIKQFTIILSITVCAELLRYFIPYNLHSRNIIPMNL